MSDLDPSAERAAGSPAGAADRQPTVASAATARATLLVSSLAVFAVFLDTTVLFVAFPDITASFPDVAPQQLSWVLNGYTIVFAAMLIPLGKLADRRGHRQLFLTGSVVFTIASLLCAIAPDPWTLNAARVLQAVGAAALVPSSLALVLRATPRERIPVTLALWGAMGAVAGAVGPTLGAALIEAGGWRWVFVLNLPVGIATVWLGRRTLLESSDPGARIPAPAGSVLLIVASSLLVLGLVRGEDWGWTSVGVVASITAGLVALAAFVVHQRQTEAPTIDLSLFEVRNFRWGNLATMAFSVAFTAMFLSSILFLTEIWGWSTLRAGFGVAPGPLSVAVLAPFMGRLAVRVGQRPLLVVGGVTFAVGGLLRLLLLTGESAYVRDYLPSMVFTGIGVALCLPQLQSVIGQALPPDRLGVGGAVNQALRQFAGTIGVALTVGLVAAATDATSALAAFDRVWWLLMIGGVLMSVLALPLHTAGTAAATPAVAVPVGAGE